MPTADLGLLGAQRPGGAKLLLPGWWLAGRLVQAGLGPAISRQAGYVSAAYWQGLGICAVAQSICCGRARTPGPRLPSDRSGTGRGDADRDGQMDGSLKSSVGLFPRPRCRRTIPSHADLMVARGKVLRWPSSSPACPSARPCGSRERDEARASDDCRWLKIRHPSTTFNLIGPVTNEANLDDDFLTASYRESWLEP